MLAKCLNLECSALFRYLHEGRLFRIDFTDAPTLRGMPPIHRIEHFWLCANCSAHLKVIVEDGKIMTRPITIESNLIGFPKPPRATLELAISTAKRARRR